MAINVTTLRYIALSTHFSVVIVKMNITIKLSYEYHHRFHLEKMKKKKNTYTGSNTALLGCVKTASYFSIYF